MNTTKSVYNKLFKEEATELASHQVHLALLDELSNINMEAGSLLVLTGELMRGTEKLDKSIQLNKSGLAKAEKGLSIAKELGEPKSIEIMQRYVKSFSGDIKRAEQGKKILAQLEKI
jgi:hypothetical protein